MKRPPFLFPILLRCLGPLSAGLLAFAAPGVSVAQPAYQDIDGPPHFYRTRTPRDRFSLLKESFESGRTPLETGSEKGFLVSLLRALDVPVSSQMLVFSTTSLQLSLISPGNPRAIYFNEELYVGYVPGGRIEIVSIDPELGGIYYIFDIPTASKPLRVERSERCMNCHAGEETGYIPGLVIKSVMPGPGGGSLTAYRSGQSGHGIPFADRFGGWHVTGRHALSNHWGNLTGRLVNGELIRVPNPPGSRFNPGKYPVPTSDILPLLLHEHQAGFVNRVVEAGYRVRTALDSGKGTLNPEQRQELEQQAREVCRYLLFADEATLPAGGVQGDAAFQSDFQRHRRVGPGDLSLKDLDLKTRLFRHRCSYMIYTPLFAELPPLLKTRIYDRLRRALADGPQEDAKSADPFDGAHLAPPERRAIRSILKATLPDLPAGW